ncbi:MAG: T9SS type A sorting domain-containing protein [Chitinophagaceae bacterium]|nr:T9SS type A sorting domain-containing protein [Chitinophagaceae bacterium]
MKAYQQQLAIAVEWKVENESGIAAYDVQRSADGIHFNEIHTTAVTGNNNSTVHYSVLDENPATGNNFYRIKSIDRSGQAQYSQTVNVKMGNTKAAISVYPNPLQNNTINLQFSNQQAGKYSIRLMNTNGQIVYSSVLNISSNNMAQAIEVPQLLAKGMYQVEINGPGNTKQTEQVIVQ